MSLIVIKNNNVVLEKIMDVFFSIEIQPVFQTHPVEFVEHLLLFKETNLLGFLTIALMIKLDKLI